MSIVLPMRIPLKDSLRKMEIDVLVDTSLLIAHQRQGAGTSQLNYTIKNYQAPAVSVVTKFEYELGELRAGRKDSFESVFSNYSVIAVSDSIWQRALYIQNFSVASNARMELADLLIASTAIFHKVPLLTLNYEHFFHLQMSNYQLRLPKIY
jgi:predicted nucleic acid-binding protein